MLLILSLVVHVRYSGTGKLVLWDSHWAVEDRGKLLDLVVLLLDECVCILIRLLFSLLSKLVINGSSKLTSLSKNRFFIQLVELLYGTHNSSVIIETVK